MLISHSHRFIFFHVGKTGGMSIREVLKPYCEPPAKFKMLRPAAFSGDKPNPMHEVWETLLLHAKVKDAQKELPADVFGPYYKFGFVRNPWDLQVSMYHFILRDPRIAKHDQVKALSGFDAFVDWVVATPDPYPRGITKLQKNMISDADGKVLLDFIGYYENLNGDFDSAMRKVGIEASLPHLNRSSHKDYRTYYNDRTKAVVAEHFAPDIELFGYTFDGRAENQPAAATSEKSE